MQRRAWVRHQARAKVAARLWAVRQRAAVRPSWGQPEVLALWVGHLRQRQHQGEAEPLAARLRQAAKVLWVVRLPQRVLPSKAEAKQSLARLRVAAGFWAVARWEA